MKINVHIERVILDGIEVRHPHVVRQALGKELTRQLRQQGLSPEFWAGATPFVAGGAIQLNQRPPAAGLGRQVAGAVFRGIRGRR
jgi:hypothetical protein